MGFKPSKQGRQELPEMILQFMIHKNNVLFTLSKLGFQPSNQGRQELPGLILQSMIHKIYYKN